jgi:hypothetical protein
MSFKSPEFLTPHLPTTTNTTPKEEKKKKRKRKKEGQFFG